MTTASGSPDYVLQIDMWANTRVDGNTAVTEHARAKYNIFKVNGDHFELEARLI